MNRHFTYLGATLALFVTLTLFLSAQQVGNTATVASPTQDPLVRVLVEKGIISSDEGRFVSAGNNQREKLLYLLKQKGVLSNADLDQLTPVSTATQPAATYQPAVLTTTSTSQAQKPADAKPPAPTFVPAIAPLLCCSLSPPRKKALSLTSNWARVRD